MELSFVPQTCASSAALTAEAAARSNAQDSTRCMITINGERYDATDKVALVISAYMQASA